jgi:putative nucleotidyltransferase with HDIG domain
VRDHVTRNRRRRISVDELQVGMYCSDVYSAEGVLILAAHIPISNPEQVAIFKRLGVETVDIDVSKGDDVRPVAPKAVPAPVAAESTVAIPTSYASEFPVAKNLYRKTILSVQHAISAIKIGKAYSTQEIEETVKGIVESVLRNPDALLNIAQIRGYNEYVYEHSVNVTILACALCHIMEYEKDAIIEAGVGAFLHDLGMIWIPETIVNKPDKLTEAESIVIKRHPQYGIEILKDRKGISELSKTIVIQHHERLNGKGYPRGLKGDQVHEVASIAGIADAYDAMTSNRVHRGALTPQQALAFLYKVSDREFPKKVTEYFVRLLGVYPVGSFVRLTSGEMGIVIRVRKNRILSPDILVLFDKSGTKCASPAEYRLSEMVTESGKERFSIDKSLNPYEFGITVSDYTKGMSSV